MPENFHQKPGSKCWQTQTYCSSVIHMQQHMEGKKVKKQKKKRWGGSPPPPCTIGKRMHHSTGGMALQCTSIRSFIENYGKVQLKNQISKSKIGKYRSLISKFLKNITWTFQFDINIHSVCSLPWWAYYFNTLIKSSNPVLCLPLSHLSCKNYRVQSRFQLTKSV